MAMKNRLVLMGTSLYLGATASAYFYFRDKKTKESGAGKLPVTKSDLCHVVSTIAPDYDRQIWMDEFVMVCIFFVIDDNTFFNHTLTSLRLQLGGWGTSLVAATKCDREGARNKLWYWKEPDTLQQACDGDSHRRESHHA